MTTNKSPSDPHGFHPEIRQIEQEIIDFFVAKTPEYTGRHPMIAAVLSYFYIRKSLTQRDLQKLTGFSAGTISKSVRQLVDMNVITKEVIPGTHMHVYKMEQLPFRFPRYFLKTETTLEKLESEVKEIKDSLDFHADEMKNFKEYQKIYVVTTQLLAIISKVPIFITLIEDELDKFLKQDAHRR